jgi:hypothetical protein
MRRFILFLLLAGADGWAALRHYSQQNRLHQQLAQLTAVLIVENDRVSHFAEGTVMGIKAAVVKNNNQPADIALLRRAEALQGSVEQLQETLGGYGDQLRHTAGRKIAAPLQRLYMPISAGLGKEELQQALARQLTTYIDTLRRLNIAVANAALLPVPDFTNNIPVTEALADLTRLESEILTYQTCALQRLGRRVGAKRWLSHPLAVATAQANVVAPGDTYRAQLGLVVYFSANELRMQMACNGRPVPTDFAGVGQVRFRAPTPPAPALPLGRAPFASTKMAATPPLRSRCRIA